MTRILWYTDGSTAGSVSGTTPLGTGTADGVFGTAKARPTTRVAVYDAIVAAFVAAGWTQHNLATRDDVFTSTGESGTEAINVRIVWNTLNANRLNFLMGVKVDGSFNLQGQVGTGNNAFESWSFSTTDFTTDYIIVGTKDFIWCNLRAVTAPTGGTANDQYNFFLGNLERDSTSNITTCTTTATASAGSLVSISVTPNPLTAGYLPGDYVQIISQATGDAAQAQTCQVTNVTSTTIEVASLAATYSTGARIGAAPCPVARFVSLNVDPSTGTGWYMPLITNVGDSGSTSDLATQPGQNIGNVDFAAGTTITAQDGFGTATTANKRTRRFTCRSLELRSSTFQVLGRVPGVYGYPGSASYYPNDTGTFNRVTPHQRYVMGLFVRAGTSNWVIGKAP